MERIAKLIMVTAANNNKFYNMTEASGSINVEYGRVGNTSVATANYPSSRWESLLKSKIKKGYKDVTGLRTVGDTVDFADISDDQISAIVRELQALANKSIQKNYTVSSDQVTQAQVDLAQGIIDNLAGMDDEDRIDFTHVNTCFLELFQAIPRRMKEVRDWLPYDFDDFQKKLGKEQDTLDVMKGQVRLNAVKKDNTADSKKDILDAMGIEIAVCTQKDIKLVKKELGSISNKFRRAFKVINKRTQKSFDEFITGRPDKRTQFFWHGSRNENWWSIIDTGLTLRPTNAVITGKMFGYGLYFADKARKSYGYTSCRGSYWARGSAPKGFMALYDVHMGKTLVHKRHEGWMSSLNETKLKKKGDYDSFTALGGADLRNNEFIVYDDRQCTIKYIVELD